MSDDIVTIMQSQLDRIMSAVEHIESTRPKPAQPAIGTVTVTEGIKFARVTDTLEVGVYPVTQAEWHSVIGGKFSGDGLLPIDSVSWNDVRYFCARVGQGVRLLTDAEWTEACGPDPADIDSHAWHRGNSDRKTHPVGEKSPNELGLYDMFGNVWEWTSEEIGGCRVLRGGSVFNATVHCRSAIHNWVDPAYRDDYFGFRVSRTVG